MRTWQAKSRGTGSPRPSDRALRPDDCRGRHQRRPASRHRQHGALSAHPAAWLSADAHQLAYSLTRSGVLADLLTEGDPQEYQEGWQFAQPQRLASLIASLAASRAWFRRGFP